MLEKIVDILARVCADDTVRRDPNLDLLASGLLDSLAFIELLYELEEAFGITLEPTQFPRSCFRSADSILALIRQQLDTDA